MTKKKSKDPAAPEKTIQSRIRALILAGGSGTRLWPLSRTLSPKQLLALNGESSLLQETMGRVLKVFTPNQVQVVTNEEHRFEVVKQLLPLDSAFNDQVLPEPMGRNTLAAIMLGMDALLKEEQDPIVAVFPADHHIPDHEGFARAMQKGFELADKGWFVTFGVAPDHPETGYGYIERGGELGPDCYEVKGFIEKPDLKRAEKFYKSGDYYWNSGMFVFKASAFLQAVDELQPEFSAWWSARSERPLCDGYKDIPDISVDYGIMERVKRIAVVKAGFGWDDLGSWEAMYRLGQKDENQCVSRGDVLAMDCSRSLLISRGGKLAAVGLEDVIAIQTPDATLVCAMDQVQKVKDVVNTLKEQGSPLVVTHQTVRRPWGSYTVLEEGPYYKIKRIEVIPGAKLSLQMHHHRSEHWVVISGTAEVQVGEEIMILVENQSVDIPKASLHRLGNPGRVPVEIIEIQSGPYLEEDDIVRFDDVYGREGSRPDQ